MAPKMMLNGLCYVLPTSSSDIQQPPNLNAKPSTTTDHHHKFHVEAKPTELHNQKTRSHRNSCRHQLLSSIHRVFSRLHDSKWLSCRSNPNTMGDLSDYFQDTAGVELYTKEVGNDNPRIFTFPELYIGTNGFSEDQILGSGGFGRVYQGVLISDGTVVAVKCLAQRGEHFEKTFVAELLAVANLRHRNLVRLRGWCIHEDELLLVYDYMPNRSLDRVLFKKLQQDNGKVKAAGGASVLDWKTRQKIAHGLAAALFYLHEQLETQIIHRDVKTSNVMLDSNFNARLGDFGLARWLEHNLGKDEYYYYSHQDQIRTPSMQNFNEQFRIAESTRIGGTIGYLPPESFQMRYTATAKSDVFSFGIVVLEVATGRRAVDLTQPEEQIVLLDWVRRLADERKLLQAGDTRIPDGSYRLSEMEILMHLGLLCTFHNPKLRPSMRWVMDVVSGNYLGKLPALPSFKSQPLYIALSSPSNTCSSNSSSNPTTTTISSSTNTSNSTIYITATGNTIFVTAPDRDVDGEGEKSNTGSTNSSRRQHMNPNVLPMVETPKEISFKEIISATNNFSDDHRVAEVDFGTAYYGVLDDRHQVIVKRLGMKTCPALRFRFTNELQNLGRLRHRNLVQLRGWCTEQGEMLVVYDYSVSRLLSNLLFHHQSHRKYKPHRGLRWPQRYNIIKALASAILYMHEEWDEQVIHRHITSASIALDADMNPRLTSFALAEFLIRNEHGNPHVVIDKKKSVQGIFGYMSPEYMESGDANTSADIYSYGVVILEVISGQMAVDFRRPEVLLVKKVHEFEVRERELVELVDPELNGEYDQLELVRLAKLGLACTRSNQEFRPNIRQIVSTLDGNDSCLIEGKKESTEKWRKSNQTPLSLTRRIQALGIN